MAKNNENKLPVTGLDFVNCFSRASIMRQDCGIVSPNPSELRCGIPSGFTYSDGTEYPAYDTPGSAVQSLYPDTILSKHRFAIGDVSRKTSCIIGKLTTRGMKVANNDLYTQCGIKSNRVLFLYPENTPAHTTVESPEADSGTTKKIEAAASDYGYMREKRITGQETVMTATDNRGKRYTVQCSLVVK